MTGPVYRHMLINKDCKTSIIHPQPDYINRIAQHIPYISKAIKNLQLQLFPEREQKSNIITALYSTKPDDVKCEQNVCTLVELLQTADVLPLTTKNRGLVNKFTQKVANPAQRSDLINF